MGERLFLHAVIAAQPLHLPLGIRHRVPRFAQLLLMRETVLFQRFLSQARLRELRLPQRAFILELQRFIFIACRHTSGGCQLQKPHRRIDRPLLLRKALVLSCSLCPFLQRHELLIEKRHHILHALHILRRLLELSESFRLPHAVQADPCHILEDHAPFIRMCRQHLIHPVLSDDRHRALTEPCRCQKLLNILQATASLIQVEITIPISKEPSRDRDLYGIERQLASAVIKDERDLRPILFPARL